MFYKIIQNVESDIEDAIAQVDLLENNDKSKGELLELLSAKINELEDQQKKDKRDKIVNMLTNMNLMTQVQELQSNNQGTSLFFLLQYFF